MKTIIISIIVLLIISVNVSALQCSANYCINNSVTASSGKNITSSNYSLQTTAGQTTNTIVTSSNYKLSQGFFHEALLIIVPLLGLPISIISFIIEEDIIKFIINLHGASTI